MSPATRGGPDIQAEGCLGRAASDVTALPYIDEHSVTVDAAPASAWTALGEVLSRMFSPRGRNLRRISGRRSLESRALPLAVGATLPGFRVVRAERGAELALEGQHPFSRYALTFRIDVLEPGRVRLRAETRAAFPGMHGRLYRALVIGTRLHALVVRRLLGKTTRRAERATPPARGPTR